MWNNVDTKKKVSDNKTNLFFYFSSFNFNCFPEIIYNATNKRKTFKFKVIFFIHIPTRNGDIIVHNMQTVDCRVECKYIY